MEYKFSDRFDGLEGNAIREIFKLLQEPSIISFAGGNPSPLCLPVEQVKEIVDELLTEPDASKYLQYGSTEGYRPYLEASLDFAKRYGIYDQTLNNIIGISGGQQGIDLISKALLNKGDIVLVEDPTYLAILHILKTYEATAVGVKCDEDSINLADLEAKIIKYKPKFVYLVPTFSNPTGKTIGVAKRKAIAAMMSKYNTILLEDDPYSELRFEGERVPSIKSFDKTGNVVFNMSFSKTISPGLRTAAIIGNAQIIRKLTIGKQAVDVHTATLNQAIVAKFITKGYLDSLIKKSIPIYKEKKDCMQNAIAKYFPKEAKCTRPNGGLFIFCELPININARDIFPLAIERKVAFVVGNSFFADGSGLNTLRLNFSNATLEQIETGIAKLGELLKEKL